MKDLTNQESTPPAPPCIFVIFGAAGSWGPVAADELLTEDRRNWHGCAVCV